MHSPTEHPRSGDLIAGKYQVEETLGAGGMGVVFAARHLALRRRVALKLLLPAAFKLPGASARFLREAQAAVAIQSEHVASVLDVGTLDTGAPYIVMEHLSGSDLARVLRDRGPLPVDEVIDFVLQAGEAIAEAHGLGIVHRDLKPANLFLTRRADRSPLVKVLDFGLSKMPVAEGSSEESLTATHAVAGSPHYMSPEQVRSLKHLDGRTDIWALGVILYELLTDRRPFNGPSASAICAAVAADDPPAMKSFRPELPPALDAVVRRCLEKDPARRTPSMGELAEALSPFAPARSAQSLERIARLSSDAAAAPPPVADAGAATLTLHPPAAPRNQAPPSLALAATSLAPVLESPDAERSAVTGDGAGWAGTQPPTKRTSRTVIAGGIGAAVAAACLFVGWSMPHGPDSASSASIAAAFTAAPPIAATLSAPGQPVATAQPSATAQSAATAQPSATAQSAATVQPSATVQSTATAQPALRPGAGAPAAARPPPSSLATSPPAATTTPASPASAPPKDPKPSVLDRPD
jgi:serine/threonine protein kinase